MFTLAWITEKELKRVIENKRDEFCRKKNMTIQSGGETMRKLMLAASKVKMRAVKNKSEHEHETKYWVSTYGNSSLKIMCN